MNSVCQAAEHGKNTEDLPAAHLFSLGCRVQREENLHSGCTGGLCWVNYLYLWHLRVHVFPVELFLRRSIFVRCSIFLRRSVFHNSSKISLSQYYCRGKGYYKSFYTYLREWNSQIFFNHGEDKYYLIFHCTCIQGHGISKASSTMVKMNIM